MNNKNIIIGVLVAIAVTFVILFVDKVPNPLVIQTSPSEVVGAVSGPEISGDALTVNGITTWTLHQPFMTVGTATSTMCNMKIPTTATTSVDYFDINVTTGPTAISFVEWGIGTQLNATTSLWGNYTLPANVPTSIQSTSTLMSKISTGGLTSGTRYLTAKLNFATTTTRGDCVAVVRELD